MASIGTKRTGGLTARRTQSLKPQILLRTLIAQGGNQAQLNVEVLFIVCSEARGLSARLQIIIPTTEGRKSRGWSDDGPPK